MSFGPLVKLRPGAYIFIEGVIETDLQREIAELDSAGAFKSSSEVESLRYTDPRQAWSRVRRAWQRIEDIERQAQEQPDLF